LESALITSALFLLAGLQPARRLIAVVEGVDLVARCGGKMTESKIVRGPHCAD
jgi:hypothetical protein